MNPVVENGIERIRTRELQIMGVSNIEVIIFEYAGLFGAMPFLTTG